MSRGMDALLLCWGLYAAVNVFVFSLYGADKRRACRGQWRIRERTLLLGAWLMGGVGAWLAMKAFRHKTRHRAFSISVPAAAVLSLLVMAWLTVRLTWP